MNSTRLRALAMNHLRWFLTLCVSQGVMLYLAAISHLAQEWLPLTASLVAFAACFLSSLDHLSDFLKYRRLYRIQADEESRWIR